MADNTHADDIRKARLAQVDARLAEIDNERAALNERRKAYTPKRATPAKKD